MLKPKAAIAFAAALHELVTNAGQHGSLSAAPGRVTVEWSIEEPATAGARLVFTWREPDGPAVDGAGSAGFGRILIENQLKTEIGANGEVEYRPDGVQARISLPLATGLAVLSDGSQNS